MTIPLLNVTIANNLVISLESVQMRPRGQTVFCVEVISMTLLTALKKCVLSVIKLDIRQKIVEKRI